MKNKFIYCLKLIIVGIVIGIFIAGFQWMTHLVIDLSGYLLSFENYIWILTILGTIICFIGIYFLNKKIPGYYGSGIPQLEAYQRGWYEFNPYKLLFLITINSLFAFFGAFLLGSEGPSVSIGSSISMIGNKIIKSDSKEDVAIGGSAGFACAFASPIAGLSHLIEENKSILSLKFIFKGIVVIGISFFVSYFIYPHSLLPYFELDVLPLKYYLVLFVIVFLGVLVGKLYIYLIVKIKDFNKNKKIMIYLTFVLLILFMCLRKFFPLLSGNGMLSLELSVLDYGILTILLVLLFRLVFTGFSVSSNVSGGVVLPMLAVGSLIAMIVIKMFSLIDVEILNYSGLFIVVGMFTVFGVVTNAPITAIILGLKCASFKVIFIPLILCLVLAMIPFYVLKWENIYHQLEKRINGYPLK